MAEQSKTVWSWVYEPEHHRPQAAGRGRYSRPLAVRDQLVVQSFGQEVRRLREERELSASELAMIVGVSQPTIIKIETDCRANIELRLLWDFAEALGVQPAHFLNVCEKAVLAGARQHLRRKPVERKKP